MSSCLSVCPRRQPRLRVRLLASFVPFTGLLAALPVSAWSQQVASASLDEVVVTGTRVPTRIDESLAEVTVIDRDEIEAATGRTVAELLARQPGLQSWSNGGLGTSSSVSMRGLEARHTLLLIDGVRYGSATVGTPIWENLPLDAIERIEIVRGPLSSLYGSDAVGGVVQIFTRRGAEGVHPDALVGLGSDGYRQLGAGVRFGRGQIDGAVQVGHVRTDGISATNEHVPFGSFNPDDDGFKQTSASARLGLQLDRDWRLEGLGLFADGESQYDDGTGVDARAGLKTQVFSLQASGLVAQAWRTTIRVARSKDEYGTKSSASPFGELGTIATTQDQYSFEVNRPTPAGTVLLVAEHVKQKVSKPGDAFEVSKRSINGFAAGLDGNRGPHTWQASLRHDRNSQFGSETTGALAYGFDLTPAWRIGASYGTSFVAPSFNQLYYPNFGNPDLQPEKGKQGELSLRWAVPGHVARLAWFDNRIRGYISSGPAPTNVPRTRIDGLALSYDGEFAGWALAASAEHLDPRNATDGSASNGLQLARRARRDAKLSIDSPRLYGWRGGAGVLMVGDRFDDAANTERLGGYSVFDLHADWRFLPAWSLGLKLNNLMDKSYETVYGYNQPGRQLFVTLRYNGGD